MGRPAISWVWWRDRVAHSAGTHVWTDRLAVDDLVEALAQVLERSPVPGSDPRAATCRLRFGKLQPALIGVRTDHRYQALSRPDRGTAHHRLTTREDDKVLLIWGWRTRMKTLGTGTFFSPAAGADAPYRLVEARRWFTLFFIPVIPLKVLGTFVECQATKATYDQEILRRPTNADFMDQLTAGVREIVAAVAVADGSVTDEERRLAIQILGGFVPGYGESDFADDVARTASTSLDARLAYLAGSLNEHGKEQLLTAAATLMTADGTIDGRDREAVRSIGEKLAMSPAHVRGVIDTAASRIAAGN
jgi:tellurite resistance protein